ncbi:ATP-dependent endonuclease, partial [Paenibacillus sp. CFBP13512]|uniref:AAA family ATPase n=1 Tax=Paenibacillus sp. CFBP13512 TaxID=2184007 RepID=UPI0010BF886F
MYISKLSIKNFRNFNNAKFTFNEGVNTLIGENGAGKSNAFYAIRMLLDATLPRSIKITENDFNRNLTSWRGHWIIIQIEFSDLSDDEGAQMLSHSIERMDDSKIGSYALYFRPSKEIRKKLFELTQDFAETNCFQEFLDKISIDDYELVFTCRSKANFNNPEIYKQYVGNFDYYEFPDPEIEAQDELGFISHKFSIYEEVTCTYIKALRDAEYELKNLRSNPLMNLVKDFSHKIDGTVIIEQVRNLNSSIGGLEEIKKLRSQVRNTMQNTIGTTYAPTIDIKSQLPEDMNKLLQTLTLWVGDSEDIGYQGQINELSLGGANLLYISLKLLEYEIKQSTQKLAHFLLIEEPEAHIHNHIQKTLFDKYNYHNTQVIVSTHSTHISAANKISSINILSKNKKEALVFQPSVGLEKSECIKIERYLDSLRSTLLFAKSVILVEGDAELILIPVLFKKIFGISLDEIGISLINMNSTVFKHIAMLFHEDRIQRKCAIITDLDKSIIKESEQNDTKDEFVRKCFNSEKSGKERKEKLEKEFAENLWVESFFAIHTFEVDLFMANNLEEFLNVVNFIYTKQNAIDNSLSKLKNENTEISYKEVLRLANYLGKGWFALTLADFIDEDTEIPQYILEAVAFCCEHFNDEHFKIAASHRIEKLYEKWNSNNIIGLDSSVIQELKLLKDSLNLNEKKELSVFK